MMLGETAHASTLVGQLPDQLKGTRPMFWNCRCLNSVSFASKASCFLGPHAVFFFQMYAFNQGLF